MKSLSIQIARVNATISKLNRLYGFGIARLSTQASTLFVNDIDTMLKKIHIELGLCRNGEYHENH